MKAFISGILTRSNSIGGTGSGELQLSLLPYHSLAAAKYNRFRVTNQLKDLPGLLPGDLVPLKQEFESLGLKVTIGG